MYHRLCKSMPIHLGFMWTIDPFHPWCYICNITCGPTVYYLSSLYLMLHFLICLFSNMSTTNGSKPNSSKLFEVPFVRFTSCYCNPCTFESHNSRGETGKYHCLYIVSKYVFWDQFPVGNNLLNCVASKISNLHPYRL